MSKRFLFPSTGKAFLNRIPWVCWTNCGRNVSIPFKRDGVSEQATGATHIETIEWEFLFPSNGTAFLNTLIEARLATPIVIKFLFPSTGTAFLNYKAQQALHGTSEVSIPFKRDGVSEL